MSDTRDEAVRVHLHGRELRSIVAEVLGPLARELRDGGAQFVRITRGWRGGPHLELAARPAGRDLPWEAVADRLRAGVAGHPAAVSLAEEEYARLARELARIEGTDAASHPLQPAGTVRRLTLAPRVPWTGELGELRTHVLTALREPLVATAAVRTRAVLLAEVTRAFLALAACHPFGVGAGTFSFRSHAEAFLYWTAPAPGYDVRYREVFDRRVGRDRPALRRLTEQALAGQAGGRAALWSEAFGACMAELLAATEEGVLTEAVLDAAAEAAQPAEYGPPGFATRRPDGRSEFHAAVDESGVTALSSAWFPAYRTLINLFYELLPVLDVTPLERYYLCHACAEAVDDVLGESWRDRLARVQALAGTAGGPR